FHLGNSTPRALRQTLEVCRAEHIPAALVLPPEGSQFRSWYSPAAEEQTMAFLRELSREFDAPIIDARTWVADDGFFDSHHPTDRGGAVYSLRLGREAILPLLTRLATTEHCD